MSAYGSSSLRHIFESTVPENPSSSSLIDSLSSSWKQIRSVKPTDHHSFTEIFGELHFKEDPNPVYSHGWGNYGTEDSKGSSSSASYLKKTDSFSSLNSESLQLCTEGLGSESLGDVEDLKSDFPSTWQKTRKNNKNNNKDNSLNKNVGGYSVKTFPPPISSIKKTGKPCVSFESHREDGRFVLKETRIPTYECLYASREDGRLRLRFIQPSDHDDDDDDVTGEVDGDKGDKGEGKEENEVADDF